jgi:dienelactone hydrolase
VTVPASSESAPKPRPRALDGYDAAWFGPEESETPVGHWVYRAARTGPSVIVIHEAFGLSRRTLGVAARVRDAGMTPVLPLLAGDPLSKRRLAGFRTFVHLCVAREFGALADGEATPTASWLRRLARREKRDSGGRPVGVIGMCFSGGYAFATALDPAIEAVVSSQPAFPAAIARRRRQFGVNADDIDRLKANTQDGLCVRTLRYQRDFVSPGVRHDAIGEALPRRQAVEIGTWNPFDHPVLGNAVDADPASPLGKALSNTVEFLRARLIDKP